MGTGFFWDERCFWHGGGDYAFMAPLGGQVQPIAAGGLPENPETKRRIINLARVTGLWGDLIERGGKPAGITDLTRVHSASYLSEFRELSAQGGGELGLRAPFAKGGYEIACLSAGLATAALKSVCDPEDSEVTNAYALTRPPGHHCLPETPNGFCLLANIAIAVEAALAEGLVGRVAVLDWDVHHGNGTEAIFYDRSDVLTISMHQERNYPLDTGDAEDVGTAAGAGYNVNLPLPPGTGHHGYVATMERIVAPVLRAYTPDVIVVAAGFDACAFDPLSRMLASAETFRTLTRMTKDLATELCGGKLVLVHEGGYSEAYVPFCAHASLEVLADSARQATDPFADTLAKRQPGPRFDSFVTDHILTLKNNFL